eukprot:TRINITY_DN22981_c0_g1_i1.p1 TRINITY_DN22981_c0_g1~~TRINITY_DN22981_c0_g1_i1.p1  ORF type:complete len:408 (-),score=42.21 TRINITY_DN22981_c0_g1_i1:1013-2236(-)
MQKIHNWTHLEVNRDQENQVQPIQGSQYLDISTDRDQCQMLEKLLSEYNPQSVPPNVILCELHQRANRMGKLKENHNQSNEKVLVCPCCRFQIDNEVYGLCTNTDNLKNYSIGIPLFFQFVRFCLFLLFIIIIIHGIKQVIDNYQSNYCGSRQIKYKCETGIMTMFCTENQKLRGPDQVQDTLNLLCSLILIVAIILWRRRVHKISSEVDFKQVQQSNFNIIISGLPPSERKEDIQEFINRKLSLQNLQGIYVQDIDLALELQNYLELQSQKKKLMEQETLIQKMEQKGSLVSQTKKESLKKQIDDCEIQLTQLQVNEVDQKQMTQRVAQVTFSRSIGLATILEIFQLSSTQRIMLKLFPWYQYYCTSVYYKGYNIKIKLQKTQQEEGWHKQLSTFEKKIETKLPFV